MNLTVGIDEVGYGPRLGPLVVAAACAYGPLKTSVRIADSKKVFSQAKGVETLEPAVLGFLPAATFDELLRRLGTRLPDAPWYKAPLRFPTVPRLQGLEGACARLIDSAEFNTAVRERNKSELLFEAAADLINRIRAAYPPPLLFLVGKQGGRHYYLRGLQRLVSATVWAREEGPGRSVYEIPGARIEFLEGAEDRHELVALASMVGKYVREGAMRLFNDWWAGQVEGLRRTAGYGLDAGRFVGDIEKARERLGIAADAVVRSR